MSSYRTTAIAIGLCLVSGHAAAQPTPRKTLPLERVRFYETGIGYFERAGVIDGASGNVTLPVPAGHLDDALKTVVVLSADDDARVTGIEFRSSASRPLAMALAGLHGEGDQPMSHEQLLGSLKGADVELRTSRGVHGGRLVEVLPADDDAKLACRTLAQRAAADEGVQTGHVSSTSLANCATASSPTLLLLSARGEIRRFPVADVQSVRPTDPAFRSRLGAALDALGQGGAQTRRQLELQATPGKPVTLGYVAEAPIWRSTYRLVLGADPDRAKLQGWALLHNDTDEDWRSVRVELCNGQPDSFLFPLAAPRYARRQLVTPQRELSTVPQLLDTTVDNMWLGDSLGDSFGAGGLGLSGIGHGGGGRGEGTGFGTIGRGAGTGDVASGLLAVGNLAQVESAEGVEAGALFRYSLPSPVDLRAHGSALMPFLSKPVRAGRIAVFAKPDETARSAIHLTNDTGQTLPPGTIALFSDGGFAGESALSRTKPSESRIVGFGFDLDVELSQQSARRTEEPRMLVAGDDAVTEHFMRHHLITHQLVNRSAAPRTVYLRLDFVRNSRVSGLDRTAFDSEQNTAYGVFQVDPNTRKNRTIEVSEGLSRSHDIKDLTVKHLERFAAASKLPEAQRKVLSAAAQLLRDAAKHRQHHRATGKALSEVERDMARLRENIRALGAHTQAAETLVERLLRAETRARSLRHKSLQTHKKLSRARQSAYRRLRQLKSPPPKSN